MVLFVNEAESNRKLGCPQSRPGKELGGLHAHNEGIKQEDRAGQD